MGKNAEPRIRLAKSVSFRLSETDYETFSGKARDSGLSEADYFRLCVLENRTEIVARPRKERDYLCVLAALNSIDRDLGRLTLDAGRESGSGKLTPESYGHLLDMLAKISGQLNGVLINVDTH